MKLSIVILCWNSRKVIGDCLQAIYSGTQSRNFEVIVSDNGSSDGSPEFVRQRFPHTKVLENGKNLWFSKGNNIGIQASSGELILILNPDTIVGEGALDTLIDFADRHPEAGAFGCRVLNLDGSYQPSARPFPTIWRELVAAFYLWPLGYISELFNPAEYVRWRGQTERRIDWQSGCCVMVRAHLLQDILAGFDERFYYYYEDVDLCRRVWQAGFPVLFTPRATITHLVGQSSTKPYPVRLELDKLRNKYRYFYKYYGRSGVRRCRRVALAALRLRQLGYGLLTLFRPTPQLQSRLELYRVTAQWTSCLDPVRLVELSEEPRVPSAAESTFVQPLAVPGTREGGSSK